MKSVAFETEISENAIKISENCQLEGSLSKKEETEFKT